MMDAYDYVVENDDIQTACDKVNAIVLAEHLKRERVAPRYKKMLEVE
ncbi:guanylate kinase, partial [Bacillus velezensis]